MDQRHLLVSLGIVCAMSVTFSARSEFASDEFEATSLASQWSWHDSTPSGSTWNLGSGHFSMKAQLGGDQYYTVDKYCYLQADAPSGTNWEIVTKIDNFDPTQTGQKASWNKAGIFLWQDNDHWLGLSLLGNDTASDRGLQGFWQADPVASRLDGEHFGETYAWGITTSTVWMKIQKTPKGYFGLVSGDGTNWIQMASMIRNPETSDGYFTGEKIRLYQSGGPNTTGGATDFADFDFVRVNSLAAPPSGFKTDEFDGTSLDSSNWALYGGFLNGQMSVSGGTLNLSPANYNDQWGAVDTGMCVYQDAPTSDSWAVAVKVAPTDLRPFQTWTGYGLMLWQDQNDWVMISSVRNDQGKNLLQCAYQGDNALTWYYDEVNFGDGALPGYLEITKRGTSYACAYSFDAINWTAPVPVGHSFGSTLRNSQIRLLVKKVDATPGAQLTAQFDWLRLGPLASQAQDWSLFQ